MTEYPPRSCGPCGTNEGYRKAAETEGDYLTENRVPRPNLVHTGQVDVNHDHGKLGIPRNPYEVDIREPPIKPKEMQGPSHHYQGLPDVGPKTPNKHDCCCSHGNIVRTVDECDENPYTLRKYGNPCLDLPIKSMEDNVNTGTHQQIIDEYHRRQHESQTVEVPPETNDGKPLRGILKNAHTETTNKGVIKECACETLTKDQEQGQVKFRPDGNDKSYYKGKSDVDNKGECYFPKPEDEFPDIKDPDDKLGPWATGRVDWGPLAGLTGVRPVVDKYSVSRFSESEWRSHNKAVLGGIFDASHRANMLEYNSKAGIEHSCKSADENQADSTKRLKQREQEIHRWKCELERSISASDEELTKLLMERQRLKHALAVLQMPESIVGECLDRRTSRLDPELVRDEVEEELIREMALIAEIREQFTRALADVEHQLLENKTAKQRLENDWSDKLETNEWEAVNVALNNRSTILMFKPGAVGFPDNQSTLEHWEKFTRDTLEESEITRQRSVALRGTLESISVDAAKNLRAQADKVELALAKRISCMEEIRVRLENELHKNLRQLADIETTTINLRETVRRLDTPMKKAQTRLDNRRLYRPRVENCRDPAHYGMVEEVKSINDSVSALKSQLKQAESVQADLVMVRGKLEREIFIKRKTLEIDRDRIEAIRAYYPTIEAMQGN